MIILLKILAGIFLVFCGMMVAVITGTLMKGKKWYWGFLNDDDPMPPENMHLWESNPAWLRKLRWSLRNPLHNFTWYVIGVKDRIKRIESHFEVYQQWNPNGGWLHLHVVTEKGTKLPFWSWWSRESMIEGYFGWRPSGAFSLPTLRKRTNEH